MKMTLAELKEKFKGKYPAGCADELLSMEDMLLHYEFFGSEEGLELGNEVVLQSKKYGEDIAVLIIRLSDNAVIFQYIGDNCGTRNLGFAMAKYNTVLKTGHCSLWALAQEETAEHIEAVFNEQSGCLPAGGAFPIFNGEKMTAILTTSGMHNGNDFRAVVDAFCSLKKKPQPKFSGLII